MHTGVNIWASGCYMRTHFVRRPVASEINSEPQHPRYALHWETYRQTMIQQACTLVLSILFASFSSCCGNAPCPVSQILSSCRFDPIDSQDSMPASFAPDTEDWHRDKKMGSIHYVAYMGVY